MRVGSVFSRQKGNWKAYAYLGLVCACLLLVFTAFHDETAPAPAKLPSDHARLAQYCSVKVREGVEAYSFPAHELFELRHLLIAIRHGDRSSIHSYPGAATTATAAKDMSSGLLEPAVTDNLAKLRSFALHAIPVKDPSPAAPEDLSHVLDPASLFRSSDAALAPGQLTSRGFMQHVSLGYALHGAYNGFLAGLRRPEQLYVRSTKYPRTIQSAGALLSALLPTSLLTHPESVSIRYFEREEDEVMHGHPLGSASCAQAVSLTRRQRHKHQHQHEQAGDVTELTDGALPKHCHLQPLPCNANGTLRASCLSLPALGQLLRASDNYYCARFAGEEGGRRATQLSFYPLLKEVLQRLLAAGHSQPESRQLLTVLSGHDTVLAPLLAVLGAYSAPGLCVWPGYASRLIFELYEPKEHEKDPVAGDMIGYPRNTQYVRILFNGQDITPLVPYCAAAKAKLAADVSAAAPQLVLYRDKVLLHADSTLCPLPVLVDLLDSLLAPHATLEHACQQQSTQI